MPTTTPVLNGKEADRKTRFGRGGGLTGSFACSKRTARPRGGVAARQRHGPAVTAHYQRAENPVSIVAPRTLTHAQPARKSAPLQECKPTATARPDAPRTEPNQGSGMYPTLSLVATLTAERRREARRARLAPPALSKPRTARRGSSPLRAAAAVLAALGQR
jgi:hypothetical protein